MKQYMIPIYGVLGLAVYALATSGVFLSRGLDWFLYFYLIPSTVALAIGAFYNVMRTRNRELTDFKSFDKHDKPDLRSAKDRIRNV